MPWPSKTTTISLCVACLAGVGGWASISLTGHQPEQPASPSQSNPASVSEASVSEKGEHPITKNADANEPDHPASPDPVEAFDVANRTPTHSIPLSDNELAQREAANRSETQVPLADDSQVTIETDRFHYEPGQSIDVDVTRTPGGVGSNAVASIGDNDTSLASSGDSASGSVSAPQQPGEQQLTVDFTVAGEALSLSTTVAVNRDIGEIDSVGRASITEDAIEIPVDVTVAESGDYRLEGYAQVSGYNWVRVEQQASLESGEQVLELAIHGSALASPDDGASDSSDELTLRSLALTQLPASPGDRTWRNDDDESERHTSAPNGIERIEGAEYTPPPEQAQLQQKRREFLSRIGE